MIAICNDSIHTVNMSNSNVTSIETRLRARQDVAAAVRAHMAVRGLKDAELARLLGWTQSYMSRRTNAGISFSVDDLGAIAAQLELDLSDLIAMPTGRPVPSAARPARASSEVGRTGLEPVTDGL